MFDSLKSIMAKIERFEDLNCCQEARKLVKIVYQASNEGAMARDLDLKSQIRRAAISSMNNIAESFRRFSKKEFIRFLEISSASAIEVKAREIQNKAEDVKSPDFGFIRYLKTKVLTHFNTSNFNTLTLS